MWAALWAFSTQFLRFGSNLLLTRFLAPEMFGIMAIVHMFQAILQLVSDLGFREAVVRSEDEEFETLFNTAWSLQVIRGAILCAVGILIAGALWMAGTLALLPASSTYASPQLPLVLAVSSLSALFGGLYSNKPWRLERDLNTRRVMIVDIVIQVLSAVFMCVLAWLTHSIWALVAGGVSVAVLQCVASYLFIPGKRARFQIDAGASKKIMAFGIWILGSSVCTVLSNNIDKLMFGWLMAPTALGIFTIGQNLIGALDTALTRIFSMFGTAALSEVARTDRAGLREKFYRMRLPFDFGLMASAGGFYASGSAIVDVIFDDRYAQVGPVAEILALTLVATRYSLFSYVFIALGRTRYLLWMNLTRLVLGIVLFPTSYYLFGFHGTVIAVGIVGLVQLPVAAFLARGQDVIDWRYEALTLGFWIPGYIAGLGLAALIHAFT